MQPIWQGTLTFLLVNLPVGLYSARSGRQLRFRLLHKDTGTPIEYRKYCPECGKEVDWDQIAKGYEYERGRFVALEDQDFEAADVELTRTIEIMDFVSLEDISPVYFDTPYFLVPERKAAKTYHLLVRALQQEGKVGIARVVIKTREHIAAVIPYRDALLLETLFFDHELRQPQEFDIPQAAEKASEREMKLAREIIQGMTGKFDPAQYRDEYREKLLQVIRRKAEGKVITPARGKGRKAEVEQLLAALQQSAQEVKKQASAS